VKAINSDAVEAFMARVRAATQANGKEVRLSILEAQELVASIGQLLARNNALLEKLVDRKTEPATIEAAFDGGRF
jgi:hypothetical protein